MVSGSDAQWTSPKTQSQIKRSKYLQDAILQMGQQSKDVFNTAEGTNYNILANAILGYRANQAENRANRMVKADNDALTAAITGTPMDTAKADLGAAKPFDLTPGGFENRAVDTETNRANAIGKYMGPQALLEYTEGKKPKPMSLYEQEQIRLKELEMNQGPKPSIFNTPDGLVEVAPGQQPKLVYGTAPEEKPPWTGAVKDENDNWIYDPDYIAGEQRMRAGSGGGSDAGTYRPATAEEKAAFGVPADVALTINTKTGKPDVLMNPKANNLYTPTEEKTYRGKDQALGTLKFLTNEYRSLVNQYGPGLFDGRVEGGEWKKTPEGQKLLAAHNNLMMFLKGPELFNLGVLTGPDVERLQRTLPEPVGMGAFGQTKETLGIGLNSLDQLVGYQTGLIPEEFRSAQAGAPPPKTRVGVPYLLAKPETDDDVSDLLEKYR
jgi:hypothetical protein